MANEQSLKLALEGDLDGFLDDTKALKDAMLDLASSTVEAIKAFLELSSIGDAVREKIAAISAALSNLGSQSMDITLAGTINTLPGVSPKSGIENEIPKLERLAQARDAFAKQMSKDILSATLKKEDSIIGRNWMSSLTSVRLVPRKLFDLLTKETKASLEKATIDLAGPLATFFTGLGNTISQSIDAKNPLTAALKGVLSLLVGFLRTLGEALVKAGAAMLAAKLLVKNPIGAIIAGTLTIAAAGFLQNMINNAFPRFATGGVVTGPTLAMVGDNPSGVEYIIPKEVLDRLGGNTAGGGTLSARVSGTDLLFVLDMANRENKRFG